MYGDIEYCSIIKNKVTGESKGLGYVRYLKPSQAAQAIENCDRSKTGLLKLYCMCCIVWWLCVCVPHGCSAYRGQRNIRSSGTGVADGCDPSCGYWEQSPGGPLEEPQVSVTTEPSFQPQNILCFVLFLTLLKGLSKEILSYK